MRPRYTTLFVLATGGMGSVELVLGANDARGRGRVYARKRLLPHLRGDAQFRAMFLDEARLASHLAHPHVVAVVDVGEDAEGPFLVMEHVLGVSAARLIAEASERNAPLPLQIGLRVCLEAARGLHAAHEARDDEGRPLGIVHRDVSPTNILIGFDGTTKVTDFGIAKAFGNASETTTGVLKGNIGYLAPEVLRFDAVDRRADLFALGVTLYELLTGQRLYAAGEQGARRILHEPPPDLLAARPDVPAELVELVFDLLAKDPADRPATAEAAAERLEAVLASLIEEEGPITLAQHLGRHFTEARAEAESRVAGAIARARATRSHRRWGWAAASVVVATALAAGASWLAASAPDAPGLLVAGLYHTCAKDGADLFCWGKNSDGQLGSGGALDSPIRRRVDMPEVRALALGSAHTCACTGDGRVFCWGRNEHGQLGRGAAGAGTDLPVEVRSIRGCKAVAAGDGHTCVLRRDGGVACWGRNHRGQAGVATSDQELTPREVSGLRDVRALAATTDTTCALVQEGRVMCWGDNSHGELGDGTKLARFAPQPVDSVEGAVEVRLGIAAACARTARGVVCWGRNEMDDSDRLRPVALPDSADARGVAVGLWFVCLLRSSGEVACRGANNAGQLGIDGPGRGPVRPIPRLTRVHAISAGTLHACALHDQGIACWGLNDTGQLGDGTTISRHGPVSVAGFGPISGR